MSKEEKKAKDYFKKYINDFEKKIGKNLTTEFNEHLKVLLSQVEKQQKIIEENLKFKENVVNLIMIWDKKELPENDVVIETLETIMHEFSRLENIEDKKIQVAVKFIEKKEINIGEKR